MNLLVSTIDDQYHHRNRRGYEYSDKKYELPPLWFNEDELTALCLALRRFVDTVPAPADIEGMISVKNIEYYRVDENIFRQTVGALLQRRPVRVNYRTPTHQKRHGAGCTTASPHVLHGQLAFHRLLLT